MDWRAHIEQDPAVLGGKPFIRGARISVEQIVGDMADGATVADILEAHPILNEEQVRAALAYAAASLSSESIVFAHNTGT